MVQKLPVLAELFLAVSGIDGSCMNAADGLARMPSRRNAQPVFPERLVWLNRF